MKTALTGCWRAPAAARAGHSAPVPLPGSGTAPCAETLMAFGSVWDTNMACSWDQTHLWEMGKHTQATVQHTGGGIPDSREASWKMESSSALANQNGVFHWGCAVWVGADGSFPSKPPDNMGGSNYLGMRQWRSKVHTRNTGSGWIIMTLLGCNGTHVFVQLVW